MEQGATILVAVADSEVGDVDEAIYKARTDMNDQLNHIKSVVSASPVLTLNQQVQKVKVILTVAVVYLKY